MKLRKKHLEKLAKMKA